MNRITTNIRIDSEDGGNFGYFTEKEDLYSKLSGVKDTLGDNMEFIEIGKNIHLNDKILEVLDINLKFENINLQTQHKDKTEETTPKDLMIELIITVKFIKKA